MKKVVGAVAQSMFAIIYSNSILLIISITDSWRLFRTERTKTLVYPTNEQLTALSFGKLTTRLF